ncbi:MAG: hypothetical protein ACREOP_08790 [Thermodesulfobacteriota bacterium]
MVERGALLIEYQGFGPFFVERPVEGRGVPEPLVTVLYLSLPRKYLPVFLYAFPEGEGLFFEPDA